MRRFQVFLLPAFGLIVLAGSLALAKDREPVNRAAIVTDQKTGTVSILIDGKRIMVIDASGAHVDGDIRYSGTITDTGSGEGLWGNKW